MKRALIRSLVLAACAAAIAGCYASRALLLDPDEAAQPLAEGTYVSDADAANRYRLTLEADGWYDVEQFNANGTIGATRHVLFNALDPVASRAAYAAAVEQGDGYAYLVVLTDGPKVYLATPDCGDPLDRDVAVDHGGEPGDDDAMTRNCTFSSRNALIAALSAYAGQADLGSPFRRH